MTIQIQAYDEKYQDQIENHILEIQNNELNVPMSIEQQPDLRSIPETYQKNEGNFWVALHNDIVIGTIAVVSIGHEQAALRRMFVQKDYRGSQYKTASLLLDAVIRWSKKIRFQNIYLGTIYKNIAAQRFYEKNGFLELPKEDLPQKFPFMSIDATFYVKPLKEC